MICLPLLSDGLQACATMPGWNLGLCECEAHTLPMEPQLQSNYWPLPENLSSAGERWDGFLQNFWALWQDTENMPLTFSVHGTDTGCGLRCGATGLLLSNTHYILEEPGRSQVMILRMASRKKIKQGNRYPRAVFKNMKGCPAGERQDPSLSWGGCRGSLWLYGRDGSSAF